MTMNQVLHYDRLIISMTSLQNFHKKYKKKKKDNVLTHDVIKNIHKYTPDDSQNWVWIKFCQVNKKNPLNEVTFQGLKNYMECE